MKMHFERIGYNGSIILVEKKNYICEDDIHLQICRTGGIQDRTDAGQIICRTEWMAGQVRYRTGWMYDRSDAGQVRCRTGQMQDRSDAGQDGCTTGQIQDRTYAGQGGWRTGCM